MWKSGKVEKWKGRALTGYNIFYKKIATSGKIQALFHYSFAEPLKKIMNWQRGAT